MARESCARFHLMKLWAGDGGKGRTLTESRQHITEQYSTIFSRRVFYLFIYSCIYFYCYTKLLNLVVSKVIFLNGWHLYRSFTKHAKQIVPLFSVTCWRQGGRSEQPHHLRASWHPRKTGYEDDNAFIIGKTQQIWKADGKTCFTVNTFIAL